MNDSASTNAKKLIRVVPPKGEHGKVLLANGTKVFVGDTEIAGVSSIQLFAEVGQPWQAVITFVVEEIDPIFAESEIDITSLSDETRRYAKNEY